MARRSGDGDHRLTARPQFLAGLCGLMLTVSAYAAQEDPDTELIEFLGGWAEEAEEWGAFFDSLPPELVENEEGREQDGRSEESDSE